MPFKFFYRVNEGFNKIITLRLVWWHSMLAQPQTPPDESFLLFQLPIFLLMKLPSTRCIRTLGSRHIFTLSITAAVIAFAGTATSYAADGSWTGLGVDSAWSTIANWSGASVPTSGNTATFNGAGNGKTTITVGSQPISVMSFNNAATAAYTIGSSVGSGTLVMTPVGSNNISITSAVTTNQRINSNLVIGTGAVATSKFQNDSSTAGQNLTIAGDITAGTGGAPGVLGITLDGLGVNSNGIITGSISNGGASSVTITKTNTGTWTLGGSNTYTGTTTVSGGALRLTNTGALTNSPVALSGATLQLRSDTGGATFATGGATLTGAPTLDAGSLSTGKGLTLNLGGTLSIGNLTATITGSNGYKVGFGPVSVTASGATFKATTGNAVIGNITGTNTAVNFTGSQPGNAITGVIAVGSGIVAYGVDGVTWNPASWTVSGQNTYTGVTTVNFGTNLVLGADSTGNPGALTSGPVGTGVLAMNGGIISASSARTIG
ncbi:MAG: beta strand repeat-containing protein, partial [Chthoniobacterales bacterium]